MASCGGDGHDDDETRGEAHADEASAEHEHGSGGEIIFPYEQALAAGVRCDTVRAGSFHGVITASAEISEASCDERMAAAGISGVVTLDGHIAEGVRVTKGQSLGSISQKGFSDGNALEKARIEYENSRRLYLRAKRSLADKIISENEFRRAEARYLTDSLAYEAIPRNKSGNAAISAPSDGYVKTAFVRSGDYVTVGQPLVSIIQNRHLYLRADLPERHYGLIGEISSAKFRTAYSDSVYDISLMDGRLLSYGKNSSGSPAFIPITFEFSNTAGIASGSYAEAYLITGPREGVISLPVGAVCEEQGTSFVYVRADSSCYLRRDVETGQSDGERIEIKSGLTPGETVVTEGAVRIRLAQADKAIPGHTHNH